MTSPPPTDGKPTARPGRRRSAARLAAVQALYQMDINDVIPTGAGVDAVIREFVTHRLGQEIDGDNFGDVDQTLFADVVKGVGFRLAELDGMISRALTEEWPLDRLETILRAILRAGAYELFARTDVPARVAINEYMDIAHAFFAGKEPALVNGVLDRLARVLRPDDFGERAGRGDGTRGDRNQDGDGEPR